MIIVDLLFNNIYIRINKNYVFVDWLPNFVSLGNQWIIKLLEELPAVLFLAVLGLRGCYLV
jgi:hypothetical protein